MASAVEGDTASAGEFGAAPERQHVPDGPPRNAVDGIYTDPEDAPLQPAAGNADDRQDEPAGGSAAPAGTVPPDDEGSGPDGHDPAGAAPVDPGAVPRPFGRSLPRLPVPSNWRVAVGLAIVPCILLIGFAGLDRSGRDGPASSVSRPPGLDPTPGGSIQQGSEDYQRSLESANDAGTAEALQTGGSFIPTPESTPEPGEGGPAGTGLEETVATEPGTGLPDAGAQSGPGAGTGRTDAADADPFAA